MKRHFQYEDLLLLATTVFWAANFSIVKWTLTELEPLVFNGLRFVAATFLLLLVQWHREGIQIPGSDRGRLIILGLVGHAAFQLLFIAGIDATSAGQASIFPATIPVITLLLVRATGTERLTRPAVIGLLVTTLGVAVLLGESAWGALAAERHWIGNLMLLAAVSCWATYTVAAKQLVDRMSALAVTTWGMVVGAVPLVVVMIPGLRRLDWVAVSLPAWGGVLYSGVFALVFAYLAWARAVRQLGPSRTAIYLNLVPVMAIGISWWMLDEQLTSGQLAGVATVLSGIYLSREHRLTIRR